MSAKAEVIGFVGADAQLRDAGQGRKVLSFRVASTDPYDKSTTWFSVSMFGTRGEKLAEMITKGKFVYVTGSFKQRTYEQNGEERTSLDVNAYDIQLLDRKEAEGGSGGSRRKSSAADDIF